MTEEEKKTLSDLFEAMGKTGAQFQIGQVIGSQTNTYNYYDDKPREALLARTDRDIKAAIEELLKAKDEEMVPLFRNKKQWWAVFRVLSTFCNYPSKMSDFVTKMNDLQVEGADAPLAISYESLRKASDNVPLMACSPTAWDAMKDKSENYAQQYAVADFLMLRLGIKS
jgi:hypothetical protein